MSVSVLERVMACPNLPSLPAVAMEVLELTRDPNVPMRKIASSVEQDQALAGKILKTVNSSFYGLSQPCPTIGRALAYLGLSTVKTLVLSFSLVDSTKGVSEDDFDFDRYWRCVLYSAVAAREVAASTKSIDPDEAFIGALLQDIGMLAMLTALGVDYAAITSCTGFDPESLLREERTSLGTTHPEAGQALAEKWRLPPELVSCIRYHHSAKDIPNEHEEIVRIVVLAGHLAEALSSDEPQSHVAEANAVAKEWFGIDKEQVGTILEAIDTGAQELARSFDVTMGAPADLEGIRAAASEQLIQHQVELSQATNELTRQVMTDALTGAANRKHFDDSVPAEFEEATRSGKPYAVLFCDADKFKLVNDTHGHQAGDAVLVELSARLRDTLGDLGTVFRYGGEEFAISIPQADGRRAARIAEIIRLRVQASPVDVRGTGAQVDELQITLSIGVAALEPGGREFPSYAELVRCADEGVYLAKESGRNRVALDQVGVVILQRDGTLLAEQTGAPALAVPALPSTGPGPGVDGVEGPGVVLFGAEDERAPFEQAFGGAGAAVSVFGEPDPLIESLTESVPDLLLICVGRSDDAGVSLISRARSTGSANAVPLIAITPSDEASRSHAISLGANAVVERERFAEDPQGWAERILKMWCQQSAAAAA